MKKWQRLLQPLIITGLLAFVSCNNRNGNEGGGEVSDTSTAMTSDTSDTSANFSDFAKDEEFRNAHQEPAAMEGGDGKGRMIHFTVEDGKTASGYLVKPEKPSDKFLLMFHEWWGLNDYMKGEAQRYSDVLGVNVLAPDLYDGQVADTREKAGKLTENADEERIEDIIEGAIKYTGKSAKLGTIGWCFGGGWSLRAAIMAEEKADACIIFYGMPVTDKDELRDLNASVLGIFAKQDKWITPKKVEEFQDAMQKVGKDVSIQSYDADHAFANPSGDNYKEKEAREATAMAERFLKEYLK